MKQFILICVLLIPWSHWAQRSTVSGVVKDGSSGELIVGADVYIEGTAIGTMTNEYGFFSLEIRKPNTMVVISAMGFANYVLDISKGKTQQLRIELQPEATELDEVVIQSTQGQKANVRSPMMGVSQLKVKDLQKSPVVFGEPDIIKSVQSLPGVTKNGEGAAGFHIRGGGADQNLVLLDEAVVYNTSHLLGFFSVFNSDAIKDVRLYKGSMPAKYGGRIASVLDVRQKDGNKKRFTLSGGIGAISSKLSVETPLLGQRGALLLAGRASYAHLFISGTNSASFYDVNLKTHLALNKRNTIYLSSYLGRDYLATNNFQSDYGNITANLRWNHVFSDKLFSNTSLVYSKYDYRILLGFMDLDWKASIANVHFKYDLDYYATEKWKLQIGAATIGYDFNPGAIKPSKKGSSINPLQLAQKRALESALYLGAEHKLSSKLQLMYGLRTSFFKRLFTEELRAYKDGKPLQYNPITNRYEEGVVTGTLRGNKSYVTLEPRVGLSYAFNAKNSIKGSYTRTAQYIHLLSNTTTVNPVDVWAPSGTYLKPQRGHQYSMGYFKNWANGRYSLEVEGYYKHVDNRIDYIDGSDLIGNNHIETEILQGDMRSYGAEFLLRKNRGKLRGYVGYTWSRAEQRTSGGVFGGTGINNGNWYPANFDRTHDISLSCSYQWNKKWSLGGNFVLQTGRPVTYPNGSYNYQGIAIATYAERNSSRLPSYHRLDVSLNYTPRADTDKKWKGTWSFGIYNLYNRRNAQDITFGQRRNTGQNEAIRTSIFGIVPSLAYNFKF